MKNVFVFGADEFNLAQMRWPEGVRNYRFHELFHHHEVKAGPEFPVEALYAGALEQLKNFPDPLMPSSATGIFRSAPCFRC